MIISYNNLPLRKAVHKMFTLLSATNPNQTNRLNPSEISVLTEFSLLDEEIFKHQRFGARAKKHIIPLIKEFYNVESSSRRLNSVVFNIYSKGWIKRDEDGVYYLKDKFDRALQQLKKAQQLKQTTEIILKFNFQDAPEV